MKKIILITILFLAFPAIASAAGSWATREEGSHFFIEGECSEKQVKIEFFVKADDDSPAYDSDIQCENGHFSFSGDLLKKKLPSGNYILAVDEEKNQNAISVKNEEYGKVEEINKSAIQPVASADPDIKFLGALASFEQSVLDMQIWLSETRYPKMVKKSVDATLDGIMALAGKITDLLWEADNTPVSSDEDKLAKTESENIPEQNVPEELEIMPSSEKEPAAPLVIDKSATLPADGLTISDSQELMKPAEELP